jgi:hypothetical protein
MNLKTLVRESYRTAVEKGWWDKPRSSLEIAALIHSEVSEFVEIERRSSQNAIRHRQKGWSLIRNAETGRPILPVGPAIELADAVIRIADYFGRMGWDLDEVLRVKMKHNMSREYRHGGKKF